MSALGLGEESKKKTKKSDSEADDAKAIIARVEAKAKDSPNDCVFC